MRISIGVPGELDEDVRFVLEKAAGADVPLLSTLGPVEARREFRRRLDKANIPPPKDVDSRDLLAGDLRLRRYDKRGAGAAKAVLLVFHGGGFVIGDFETHDALCRSIASRTATTVVAVDYRLAPEHRYPAAVEDAEAALDWVRDAFPGLPIGLCGDSAGGTLAAVTALHARDRGIPVAVQILIYPAVDQGGGYPSRARFGQGFLLSTSEIAWFARQYFGGDELMLEWPVLEWRASPLRASPVGVAPAIIITAGHDPLADEGEAYARHLAEAGVTVRHVCLEGSVHGCLSMARFLASGRAALDEICRAWSLSAGGEVPLSP